MDRVGEGGDGVCDVGDGEEWGGWEWEWEWDW